MRFQQQDFNGLFFYFFSRLNEIIIILKACFHATSLFYVSDLETYWVDSISSLLPQQPMKGALARSSLTNPNLETLENVTRLYSSLCSHGGRAEPCYRAEPSGLEGNNEPSRVWFVRGLMAARAKFVLFS